MHLRVSCFILALATSSACVSGGPDPDGSQSSSTSSSSSSSSSGGSSGGSSGSTTSPSGTGACASRQATLRGSAGTTTLDETYTSSGYALLGTSFTGTIGTGGRIEVVLNAVGVSSAGTAFRSATLRMPSEGPLAGKTVCAGGGTITSGSGAYTFKLQNLTVADAPPGDAGTCTGESVTGEIDGCIGGR